MRKTINQQRVTICRLCKKLRHTVSSNCNIDLNNLPQPFLNFICSQSRLCRRTKKGRRYGLRDKELTLSLLFCIPQAYRFCQNLFALPCRRTLQLWLSRLRVDIGFCQSVFTVLKQKVNKFDNKDKTLLYSF